jgi:putative membrane protein
MKFLVKWAVGALALYLTVVAWRAAAGATHLAAPGALDFEGNKIIGAIFSIVALTLVNKFVRPVVNLLALPLNCLTLGLMRFVINALMFWLVGTLKLGLRVDGFVPALFGSIVLSCVSGILDQFITEQIGKKSK